MNDVSDVSDLPSLLNHHSLQFHNKIIIISRTGYASGVKAIRHSSFLTISIHSLTIDEVIFPPSTISIIHHPSIMAAKKTSRSMTSSRSMTTLMVLLCIFPFISMVVNVTILERQRVDEINNERSEASELYYKEIPQRDYMTDYLKIAARKRREQLVVAGSKKIKCNGKHILVEDTIGKKDFQKLKKLAKFNLCQSLKQQKKFFKVKDKAIKWIHSQGDEKKRKLLYGPPGTGLFAVALNKKFAFRHIFKSGGSTVLQVTKGVHINKDEVGKRSLITVVRDPIDHFLSGWAECGSRSKDPQDDESFSPNNVKLGKKARSWMDHIQTCLSKPPKERGDECVCAQHSHPQANFLLNPNGGMTIDPKVEFVGDISEIHGMLKMVGLKYDETKETHARSASDSPVKVKKFHVDKHMLSKIALLRICQFVILDYYLFDFKPPNVCRDQVAKHIAMIKKQL